MPNVIGTLPVPGSTTNWGSNSLPGLNAQLTLIDNVFAAAGNGTSVGIQIGSGKTLAIGGTGVVQSGGNFNIQSGGNLTIQSGGAITIATTTATTNSVQGNGLVVSGNSSGTVVAGFGQRLIDGQLQNAAGTLKDQVAVIDAVWDVATAGSEQTHIAFGGYSGGAFSYKFNMGLGLYANGLADKGTGSGNFSALYVNGTAVGGSSPVKHVTVLTGGTTWTTNANTKFTTVTVIGGGGNGGSGGGSNGVGGGGGAGGIAIKTYTTLAPNTAYTISVGGIGGNTTFTDGTTLITGGGGSAGTNGGVGVVAGGAGGTATNGDINLPGQKGGYGMSVGTTDFRAGIGGSGMYGGGAPQLYAASGNVNGLAATGYGAGGGGGINTTGAAGAGTAGAIIIEEWY